MAVETSDFIVPSIETMGLGYDVLYLLISPTLLPDNDKDQHYH